SMADQELDRICDALEEADGAGMLELESQNGIGEVILPGGKHYIVSKHAPTRPLWLSAPISGGLHFSSDAAKGWALADGRTLCSILGAELRQLGIKVEIDE